MTDADLDAHASGGRDVEHGDARMPALMFHPGASAADLMACLAPHTVFAPSVTMLKDWHLWTAAPTLRSGG